MCKEYQLLLHVRPGIYSVSEHCNMSGPGFTVYQTIARRQAQGLQGIRTQQHVRPSVYCVSDNCNTSSPGFTVYQKTATRHAQGLQCIRTLYHVRLCLQLFPTLCTSPQFQSLHCIWLTLQHFKHRVYSSSEQNTKSGPWLQCTIHTPQSFRPKFTVYRQASRSWY